MATTVDDLTNDFVERVKISPKSDESPGSGPSSTDATTSVGPSEEYLTFGIQLPEGEGKLDLPSVIRDIAIRVDQKKSTQPAVAPRALIFFLGPPKEHFQDGTWDFKPEYTAFKKKGKKGVVYAATLKTAAGLLPPDRPLDGFFLADGVPVLPWPKREEALPPSITWSQFFLCVTWVRTLVRVIRPEEVYFAGALSVLAGLLGLCTIRQEHLASSIDTVINEGKIGLQNWAHGRGRKHVLAELENGPIVDAFEGLRPKFIAVCHPGARDAKAPQEFATVVGKKKREGNENEQEGRVERICSNEKEEEEKKENEKENEKKEEKEKEQEQKKEQEQEEKEKEEEEEEEKAREEEEWNFDYWQKRSAGEKPRGTPKRIPGTPKSTTPSTTTSTSTTPSAQKGRTVLPGKELFGK